MSQPTQSNRRPLFGGDAFEQLVAILMTLVILQTAVVTYWYTLADDTQRLTLPSSAITAAGGQHHVWVIDSGALQRRAVTLGRRDERQGRVEVLDGVTPAATVLAARFDNLREGAKATVVAVKASPVASASAPAAR